MSTSNKKESSSNSLSVYVDQDVNQYYERLYNMGGFSNAYFNPSSSYSYSYSSTPASSYSQSDTTY